MAIISRILEEAGNGGKTSGALRIMTFLFSFSVGIVGWFLLDKVSHFENTLEKVDENATMNIRSISLNAAAIKVIREDITDRYRGSQAISDWANQRRRDDAQDRDRERIESRVESINRFR